MNQGQWDEFEIKRWSRILRAGLLDPRFGPTREELAHHVLMAIQRWVKVFPFAGRPATPRATGAIVAPEAIPMTRRIGLAERAVLDAAEAWVAHASTGSHPDLWAGDNEWAIIEAVNGLRELNDLPLYGWAE